MPLIQNTIKLNDLPLEILSYIESFVGNPGTTARCCRMLNDAVEKSFYFHAETYKYSSTLNSYYKMAIDSLFEPSANYSRSKWICKTVFQTIMTQTKSIPGGTSKIAETKRANHANILDVRRLETLAAWSENQLKTDSLPLFFLVGAQVDPILEECLEDLKRIDHNSFKALKNYSSIDLNSKKLLNLNLQIFFGTHFITLKLQNIKKLVLHDCHLQSIPQEIEKFSHLEELTLSSNQIRFLPREIGALKQLKALDAGNNQLQMIPAEIGYLPKLQTLLLNQNKLKALPKELGNLSQLETMNLSNNFLNHLPHAIGQLTALKELNLSANPRLSFPIEICALHSLETLNLADNHIEQVPQEIKKMRRLTHLNLKFNQIKGLPKDLFLLEELEILNLARNQLSELDPEIQKLKKLKTLDLTGNQIKALPKDALQSLSSLKKLTIAFNPGL